MENKHRNVDDLFRKNISEYIYSEEKGNWELVKHLLKSRARARKRIRKIQYILSLLIISSAVSFLLLHSKEKNNQTPLRVNQSDADFPRATNKDESRTAKITENSFQKRGGDHTAYMPPGSLRYASGNEAAEKSTGESELLKPSLPSSEEPVQMTASGPNFSDENFDSAINSSSWGSDSLKIEITNIGREINSAFSDFAPVISADGSIMFFTSRRPVTEKETKQHKQAMEHIYSSTFNGKKNKWIKPFLLDNTINPEGRNNSAIGLSNDGQRMLLYRDDIHGNGDIYESLLRGNEWAEPVLLPEPVNTKYHESSASISPDGRTLYFVSDRPGGLGGRDIWYCVQDASEKWGKAINIGEPINTKDDEEGIFIHPDGKTIYFSSRGHGGFGGYDIYRTVFLKTDPGAHPSTWERP